MNIITQRTALIGMLLFSFSMMLTGCETFGVPNEQWKQLTPQQKEIAMQNYYQQQRAAEANQAEIDKINAQNAPVNNLISGITQALPEKTKTWNNSHSTTTSQCSGSSCESQTNTKGSSVSITSPF